MFSVISFLDSSEREDYCTFYFCSVWFSVVSWFLLRVFDDISYWGWVVFVKCIMWGVGFCCSCGVLISLVWGFGFLFGGGCGVMSLFWGGCVGGCTVSGWVGGMLSSCL